MFLTIMSVFGMLVLGLVIIIMICEIIENAPQRGFLSSFNP